MSHCETVHLSSYDIISSKWYIISVGKFPKRIIINVIVDISNRTCVQIPNTNPIIALMHVYMGIDPTHSNLWCDACTTSYAKPLGPSLV